MAQFVMPSLGADMESGVLLEWLVAPGATVHRGDLMAVVDTDKAAVEVESFSDGVVDALLVEPGTRVAVGTPMATLLAEGEAAPAQPPAQPPAQAEVPAVEVPVVEEVPVAVGQAPVPAAATVAAAPSASPPVRHHAAEVGVDLATVTGTGRGGRITRADVDRAAKQGRRRVSPYARRLAGELGVDLDSLPTGTDTIHASDVRAAVSPAPAVSVPPVAAAESPRRAAPATATAPTAVPAQQRSPRATIAALMSRSKREIPHYYVAETVSLETMTRWLRRTNRELPVSGRIVPAAVLLKAAALALRDFPELNGFWTDDHFVPAEDVHLGVAVSVRGGALVAPAIHTTADLAVPEVMSRLRDLVRRARSGRLTRAEMADPTLTVTDLGDQGVEEVMGVIYPPQVALLGVGRIVERPWAVDGRLGVSPVVRLTLSGDHRATDGSTGARFLNAIDRLLQRPEEL